MLETALSYVLSHIADAVYEHKRVDRVQGPGLPFPDLRQDLVRDLADHLCPIDPASYAKLTKFFFCFNSHPIIL